MFKKIGLKYRTNRASKKREHQTTVAFAKSKKAGVVTSKDIYKTTGFKSFIETLANKGITTDVLIFSEEKVRDNKKPNHYSKEDYSWTGKIKNPIVNKFVKTPFDFLFSVNTSSILQIENILAKSNARCRIGTTSDDIKQELDFIVKVNAKSSIDTLTGKILQYSENIN